MILTYQIQIYVLFHESSNKEYCYIASVYQGKRLCDVLVLNCQYMFFIMKKEKRICFGKKGKFAVETQSS